jgi:hypothetical protein
MKELLMYQRIQKIIINKSDEIIIADKPSKYDNLIQLNNSQL